MAEAAEHDSAEAAMSVLTYLKAVVGAVGTVVFPPICNWLVTFVPAPADVQTALSILLMALLTGGAIAGTPNSPKRGSNP